MGFQVTVGRDFGWGQTLIRQAGHEGSHVTRHMREPNLRTIARTVQVATVCICMAAATALGQQTLSQYGDLRTTDDEDLVLLDQCAALSPEQYAAARKIVHRALSEVATLVGESRREWVKEYVQTSVTGGPENSDKSRAGEMAEKSRIRVAHIQTGEQAIERHALGELLALLTPEQVAGREVQPDEANDRGSGGWAGFERQRRLRTSEELDRGNDFTFNTISKLPANPRLVIHTLKLGSEDLKLARPILRRYEKDMDPVVIAQLKAIDEQRIRNTETLPVAGPDRQGDQSQRAEIKKLRVRALEDLERALSPEAARGLIEIRIAIELSLDSFEPPSKNWFVRLGAKEVQSLTPEQRSLIGSLSATADQRAADELRVLLHVLDRSYLTEPLMPEARAGLVDKARESLNRMVLRLIKDVESTLTPAQLEEFSLAGVGRKPGKAVLADPRASPPNSDWLKKTD